MAHLRVRNLNVWYNDQHSLRNLSCEIPDRGITAILGPSGCGKTTLLKSLNRLLEETENTRITGEVFLDDKNIYHPETCVTELRTKIGFLAPKPFPLPMSIYDNVAYGPRVHSRIPGENGSKKERLDEIVERNLRAAGLWQEVHDRLRSPASHLSTGQQQRLCLARALAVQPEVLLCDEPTSALDPIAAQRIEAQLMALKEEVTIIVVTHLLRQARRLADHILVLWMGELIEHGSSAQVFSRPMDERTNAYLAGDIG
jgi:phosphate transport system ATP-binding protein